MLKEIKEINIIADTRSGFNEYTTIRMFCGSGRQLNFTKAAEELYTSIPMVTYNIKTSRKK